MTRKFFKYIGFISFVGFIGFQLSAKIKPSRTSNIEVPSYAKQQDAWVEKIISEMTIEEKVGQLFMIAVYSNRPEADYRIVESQISKYHLGGVAFFQGNALKQAELTNRYQAAAKIPLLVGLDAEWGLGMRLNNTVSFPKAITLGATKDATLIENIGQEIGKQCKRIGVHINFAPVADINSNPSNPVINYRSFGESVENVSNLTRAFARGMKKENIMASAKHFPGHGDTHVDSHKDLPVLSHTLEHLETIEIAPFRAMIQDSIGSVMIGHLNVPVLDDKLPASVSYKIVTQLLKEKMGFQGLVISDALNMRGLLKTYPVGKAEVEAFKAGNDILLQTLNIDKAYNAVLSAVINEEITEQDLDKSVRKILKAKFWVGLNQYKPINLKNISADILNENSNELIQKVYNKAITVVRDEYASIPLKGLANVNMASISVAGEIANEFQNTLDLYGNVEPYYIENKPSNQSHWKAIADQAAAHDLVIVSLHKLRDSEKLDYGITEETLNMLKYIKSKTKLIVVVFGNPYSLKFFDEFETLICGYADENEAHLAAANVVFGTAPSLGKVPVNTLSKDAKLNSGYQYPKIPRLGLSLASEVDINEDKLSEVSRLVNNAILNKEFPGAQVLVARKGKVVFYEGFGNLNYEDLQSVDRKTIYDLASITKIASTLQAIMFLYNQKELDINQKLSYYLPELESSNKGNLIIKDILLHQAGLRLFSPFFENTKNQIDTYNPEFFSAQADAEGYNKIAPNLAIKPSIKDSVFAWVERSALIGKPGTKYVYSDLGLLLLQKLVEKISGRNLDAFVGDNIYKPMGLNRMHYNIYQYFDLSNVAPTEISGDFRKAAIQGTVHDPNAALLGGVAGHAGLFSNAWDLAQLMQMNLWGGKYNDLEFISKKTIDFFTENQSNISHRGLGWNKPSGPGDGTVSQYASDLTYGHTGFTGTCVWVDPAEDLIFVFLSNRVYPSANNQKIITNKTRQKVHDAVYRAIIK